MVELLHARKCSNKFAFYSLNQHLDFQSSCFTLENVQTGLAFYSLNQHLFPSLNIQPSLGIDNSASAEVIEVSALFCVIGIRPVING